MSLSKNLKSPPAPIVAKATTQTRSQRAANNKSGVSNQRVPKALPTYEGVEILQYVENGPSPNYSTWIEQLALAVEQSGLIFRGYSPTKISHTGSLPQ